MRKKAEQIQIMQIRSVCQRMTSRKFTGKILNSKTREEALSGYSKMNGVTRQALLDIQALDKQEFLQACKDLIQGARKKK